MPGEFVGCDQVQSWVLICIHLCTSIYVSPLFWLHFFCCCCCLTCLALIIRDFCSFYVVVIILDVCKHSNYIQNHRIVEVGRHLEISLSNSLLKQSQLEEVVQNCIQWTSLRTAVPYPPLDSLFKHLNSWEKRVFFCVQMEFSLFEFVPFASCPLSGIHLGSIFFTLSH